MLKFDAAGLFVNDMETMVTFYRDVLGMTTDWAGEANAELYSDGMRLIMFSRSDFEALTGRTYAYPPRVSEDRPEGADLTNKAPMPSGVMELSFGLPDFADVDREYQRVIEAGAVPVFPPTDQPWGQRTSYVADPDGNLIEISSFGQG